MTATGITAAATLLIVLLAAGGFVWRLNEKRNAHPAEHNTITGTGADL
ncbi:membrane protein [Gordonia phage Posh]|nr:membrane protein [Gordonia phage Posh]UOW93730.1 membrane protein [Gordonia phage Wrigley]